jgi:type I restriction enzyme M protein
MAEQEKSAVLRNILWEGADILRSKMDANEYKDYLLSIVFYKYLSDKLLNDAYDLWHGGKPASIIEAQKSYEEAIASNEKDFIGELKSTDRYLIKPSLTFTKLAENAANNTFQRADLKQAFNDIEQSDKLFEGLFEDVDLYSTRLGTGELKQNQTISDVIKKINEADLTDYSGDILGDAYEYMIGQFASETGKKAGEFYTPKQVSQILAQIVVDKQEDTVGLSVYDAAMGSGSLLLMPKCYSHKPGFIRYYGQELMTSTYNLARMNMFLHAISPESQHLHNADTLDADWPTEEETNFDCVVMNPPYSQNWSAAQGFLTDPRFSDYGVLPPKSKADYAFLLHGFYHLKNTGTMAIVLPHGVLFRGSSEGTIRQKLLESGSIYAVIGLPSNLFYNTTIPTCIMVLKKKRNDPSDRSVLFIDASQEFEHGKNQNKLSEENINSIISMYRDRKDVEKHAHLADFDEIQKNDFNLNIPRYVDTFEKEPDIDLVKLANDINDTDSELKATEKTLLEELSQLTTDDEDSKKGLDLIKDILKKDLKDEGK